MEGAMKRYQNKALQIKQRYDRGSPNPSLFSTFPIEDREYELKLQREDEKILNQQGKFPF